VPCISLRCTDLPTVLAARQLRPQLPILISTRPVRVRPGWAEPGITQSDLRTAPPFEGLAWRSDISVPPTGLRFARQNARAGLSALAVSVAALNSAERTHAVRVFRPTRNGQRRQLILDRLDPNGPSIDFDRRRPPSKLVIRSGDLRNDVKRTKPRPNQMVK